MKCAIVIYLTDCGLCLVPGSTFHIELLFQTQNGTGTGEIDLEINTADGIPVGQGQLMEPLAPGGYNVTWTVSAKPDPNCDPTQEPCEEWIPGNYTANVGRFMVTHTNTYRHTNTRTHTPAVCVMKRRY